MLRGCLAILKRRRVIRNVFSQSGSLGRERVLTTPILLRLTGGREGGRYKILWTCQRSYNMTMEKEELGKKGGSPFWFPRKRKRYSRSNRGTVRAFLSPREDFAESLGRKGCGFYYSRRGEGGVLLLLHLQRAYGWENLERVREQNVPRISLAKKIFLDSARRKRRKGATKWKKGKEGSLI